VGRTNEDTKEELAGEVWSEMVGFHFAHREQVLRAVQSLGLTPGDLKALLVLQPDEPQPMGALAQYWDCDASNATWMVDRLEERGFVKRHPHPRDRRVKTVMLTARGVEMKTVLIERLSEPPLDLIALDRADLETLRDALTLLPPHAPFGRAAPPATERAAG
jgi:DNA-binding MarR family transcriptional regulator